MHLASWQPLFHAWFFSPTNDYFSAFPAIRFICAIMIQPALHAKKNVLEPVGAGGRHCPCRTFLRPVGNAVVPLFFYTDHV
jgi:hypothetical protein